MKFKIDFMSQISVEVKADNEEEAVELARADLNSYMTRSQLVSNAEVTNLDILEEE